MKFIEKGIDYRTLYKMKDFIYNKYPKDEYLPLDVWKNESKRFMHIFSEDIEEILL
jgi:hypothetical protein